MPARPFPFVDDNFDISDNPNEVRPTADNPRFPLVPPKANVAENAFTKAGQKFAERLVEATNTGHPDAPYVDIDDMPAGLIRAFEAADAAPAANVSNLSAGTLKPAPTGDGELLVVEVLLNPMAVCPDPMNGRTILDAVLHRRRLLTATADAEPLGLPVFDLLDAAELLDMAEASRSELGFNGVTVAPGKDFQDLVSVGLQGVHEPILVVPVQYRTPDGSTGWQLVALDGNRRLSMLMRAIKECSTLSWGQLAAWSHHMRDEHGGARIADYDAAAVNAVRRAAQFNDHTGGVLYPASQSDADIAAFLEGPAERSMRLRTLMRCRAVRAQLVVGVNGATLSPAVRDEASVCSALAQRIVRRRHIEEAAQKPWSADAQNIQVATGALRRVKTAIEAGADFVPLTADEAAKIIDSNLPAWAGATDDALHPLRVAAKVAATLICDDHDGTAHVREEMKAFAISVNRVKLADNRAKLAAERIMPLLGFTDPSNSRYRQVRAVIDRVLRSRAFTDCAKHPDSDDKVWWEWLDADVDAIAKAAEDEVAALGELKPDKVVARREAADSTGVWGPATRAMVLLSLVATAASPAVTASKSGASQFAVTLNGLGGSRGETMTTPDHLMFRVAVHPQGIAQMTEIVRSALAARPKVPKNVIDPTHEVVNNPGTKGYLTEEFLRSRTFGWTKESDNGRDEDPGNSGDGELPPYQRYQNWVQRFLEVVTVARNEADAVGPGGDPELRDQFTSHGLGMEELAKMVAELSKLVARGDFIAEQATS